MYTKKTINIIDDDYVEKTLNRFLSAQQDDYDIAYKEMQAGQKCSHWMWYVFPQLKGLGKSPIAKHYGIQNIQEAIDYINHPVLGKRLKEISQVLLDNPSNNPTEVMGSPDDLKLKSCMTLFYVVAPDEDTFKQVLDKYFNGEFDENTIRILKEEV